MTQTGGKLMLATAGLRTDRYELTMLSSLLAEGMADRPAVFELFARRLPCGRRYGVVAGLGRFLDQLQDFCFPAEEIDYLIGSGAITTQCADYLSRFRFTGDIDAYREGELYFPNSPLLTVASSLGQGLILETLALSIFNHDSAIASAASRMQNAAEGRPLIEMGSRRTHEDAAIAAARAAFIAGFSSTSNLAAGYQYGIPTVGTVAHAFILAHRNETAAFAAQVKAHGPNTTLLVDTYDSAQGIRNAVEAARSDGGELGAIRIDSGDLAEETRTARELLDSLGATTTKITVTSDLDEYVIAALADCPIDAFGVGTRLVTGSGHPTAGMIYKLVAVADDFDGPMRSVAKTSRGKLGSGGRKKAFRIFDDSGLLVGERLMLEHSESLVGRALQVPAVRAGEVLQPPTLDDARAHHLKALAELPLQHLQIADGPPAFTATLWEEKP